MGEVFDSGQPLNSMTPARCRHVRSASDKSAHLSWCRSQCFGACAGLVHARSGTGLHTLDPTSWNSSKTMRLVRKLGFPTTNSWKCRNHQFETFGHSCSLDLVMHLLLCSWKPVRMVRNQFGNQFRNSWEPAQKLWPCGSG